MKFCKDCAHFHKRAYPSVPVYVPPSCRAPQSCPPVDVIYGSTLWYSAEHMRFGSNRCGEDAKWFEPKQAASRAPWWRSFTK